MPKVKRRIVAYCPKCQDKGYDSRLVPYESTVPGEDFLCVQCWHAYTQETAQGLHDRYGGKYRGLDKSPKQQRHTYITEDGKDFSDGRKVGAHIRSKGVKLKHIKRPI